MVDFHATFDKSLDLLPENGYDTCMDSRFLICATRSMREYASSVVDILSHFPSLAHFVQGFDAVQALQILRFADGEIEVELGTSIRGKTIFLFTSCARNGAGIPNDEAKLELYHAVDALKRAQPKRIVVFEPYVSSSRSDRTTRRNSVGLWVHFKTLASLGASHIITFQLHSDKSKIMLDPLSCAIDDIPALPLLKRHICDRYIADLETLNTKVRDSWAFCSVDAGGEKLARGFANAFGTPLVIAHKQRNYGRANTIDSVYILSAEPLEGKILWIVDDMIDTGGSVQTLVEALVLHRPKEINLAVVHPVLSHPATERLTALYNSGNLSKIITTDTVCCQRGIDLSSLSVEQVSSRELAAKIIYGLISGRSLSTYFESFSAEKYLTSSSLFNLAD